MIPYALKMVGFRSIDSEVSFPFGRKFTFLTGPNNVGKTNILKALAVVANKAHKSVSPADIGESGGLKVTFSIPDDTLRLKVASRPNATRYLAEKNVGLQTSFNIHPGGIDIGEDAIALAQETLADYFRRSGFRNDLGSYSDNQEYNVRQFLQSLGILEELKGSTYLPHLRFITINNQEPPRYLDDQFPGETIAFGNVVSRLAQMDRPTIAELRLADQLVQVQDFMAFCLEADRVSVQVSHDRTTIIANVDGVPRSLASLGSGIEQLLMIGLASMGFKEKLVLLDEPELHLHPRAQKRMMSYLNNNVDARFVIATHSAASLDAVEADIIQVSRISGRSSAKTIANNSERSKVVSDLGHSPSELVLTRFAIWVEGPSDRIYLNHWIKFRDSTLVEGADYAILYYGGSVLAQHTFIDQDTDDAPDLVRALSMSRSFAVIIDSDKTSEDAAVRDTKLRVQKEIASSSGYCWITAGREVENYVSSAVLNKLKEEFSYLSIPQDHYGQVLDPKRAVKVAVARRAVELDDGDWPLDLNERVSELVARIRAAP